ncbi:conserved hypothetical protein (putative transposase or invertase) [Desulfonispora thiosulfatigenes DSM 11270]|uniref:Transposase (putative) YhgA-like domain-containing protein n=1 Tax=Desulfonispora thiosulfatigenes DSM 11270 TaxID=656914 RepID=A0A1W1V6K3_DESTI|nr:hypothetical protein [Desulfonispora thiosulfatigenes]SMB88896.1 conserved hypothetical protein (putative transposase or invertase) [Desulfonispora thiosulfatigenes DSM 11270]
MTLQMLPVLRHEFINIREYTEKDIKQYNPVTRMVLRSLKYIFEDKEKLIEAFVISVDEIESTVTEEEFNKYIDILLIYYSSVNKNLTEEDILRKVQELGGKGERIMTILQEREQKGIEKGIQQGIIEMTKNLIRDGVDIELIIKASKLSREKIEDIREEMLN